MVTTDKMGMDLPDVLSTTGPEWATKINTALEDTLDTHDHTTGNGVKVPVAGMNINADLDFVTNNATNLRSTRHQDHTVTLSGTNDKSCLYFVNGNLHINNDTGVAVQITDGTGINIASTGTIGGDYGQPGVLASATYSDITKTFSWTQSAGVTAKMALGDLLIYENVVAANPVTLKSPTALGAAIDVELPSGDSTLSTLELNETISGTRVFNSSVTFNGPNIGRGIVPHGTVVALDDSLTGAWVPTSGVPFNGWQLCDGAAIPGGNTLSGNTPAISDDRFIMGSISSGTLGGLVNQVLTTANIPAHTHDLSNHSHTGPNHSHSGTTNSNTVNANRDTGGTIGGGVGGNSGIPAYFGASFIEVATIAGSGHTHSFTTSNSGTGATGGPSNNTSGSTGSGTSFSIIPKHITMRYIIRVD